MWEKDNNPDFRDDECNQLIEQLKLPSFTLTPKKWISLTNAKGIVSKQGNNGGTLAHRDIALDFQLWLDPAKRYEVVKLIGDIDNPKSERKNVNMSDWVAIISLSISIVAPIYLRISIKLR